MYIMRKFHSPTSAGRCTAARYIVAGLTPPSVTFWFSWIPDFAWRGVIFVFWPSVRCGLCMEGFFFLCSLFGALFSPLPSFGLQHAYLSALFPSTVLHHFSFYCRVHGASRREASRRRCSAARKGGKRATLK